jgi:hypothetical protein
VRASSLTVPLTLTAFAYLLMGGYAYSLAFLHSSACDAKCGDGVHDFAIVGLAAATASLPLAALALLARRWNRGAASHRLRTRQQLAYSALFVGGAVTVLLAILARALLWLTPLRPELVALYLVKCWGAGTLGLLLAAWGSHRLSGK